MDSKYVYLGLADRQMEGFIAENNFISHFWTALLFEGRLVIPSVYFFISENLHKQIVASNSILIEALKIGLIKPAFEIEVIETCKDKTNSYFTESLNLMYRKGQRGILSTARHTASILDEECKRIRFEYSKFPDDTPYSFCNLSKRVLQNELTTQLNPDEQTLWKETHYLRHDLLSRAIGLSGEKGLTRGAVYRTVAKHYRLDENSVADDMRALDFIRNTRERFNAKRFIKWINYCYHYNHGQVLAIDSSLISVDRGDSHLINNLVGLTQYSNDNLHIESNNYTIPSIKQLSNTPPDKLLEVRLSSGEEYFRCLKLYRNKPNNNSENELDKSLSRYAAELSGCYAQHGKQIRTLQNLLSPILINKRTQAIFHILHALASHFSSKISGLDLASELATVLLTFKPVREAAGKILAKSELQVRLDDSKQTIQMDTNKNTTIDTLAYYNSKNDPHNK